MFRLYLLFGPMIILPACFLMASAVRIGLHYGDGKGGGKTPFKKYAMSKKLLTLLLTFIALLCICDLDPTSWPLTDLIVRGVYFAMMSIAFLTSYFLISFDSRRQLESAWLGQRGFWPLSFVEGVICLVFQIDMLVQEEAPENVRYYMISRCALDAIFVGLTAGLSYLALLHPNDFYVIGHSDPLIRGTYHASPKGATRFVKRQFSSEEAKCDFTSQVSATVTDFKAKIDQGLIVFRILVKVGQSEHSAQRSYSEFKCLHDSLQSRFSKHHFPKLAFPALPQISRNGISIDEKIQKLNEYLTGLCVSELMNEELLDFLGIEGKDRIELTLNHDAAMRALGLVDASPSIKGSFHFMEPEPSSMGGADSLTSFAPQFSSAIYITVTIVSWVRSSEPDGHINYNLEWKCLSFSSAGSVAKRFNEFYTLHQGLKSELAPCDLPGFPKKNYLPSFSRAVDEDAINIRRAGLEEYLRKVCNDPAYLSDQSLLFLGCPIPKGDFWSSRKTRFEYSLFTPISWEGELDDDETHYTVYLLTFLRRDLKEPTSTMQWKIGRRFREFDKLHGEMCNRVRSPAYLAYCAHAGLSPMAALPQLPKKSLVPITTHLEIEQRRKALQSYLLDLMKVSGVLESYAFRVFIQEPSDPVPADS